MQLSYLSLPRRLFYDGLGYVVIHTGTQTELRTPATFLNNL